MQRGERISLSDLLGAWQLISWQLYNPSNANPLLPMGENPSGMLLYTADGWVSASIARTPQPTWTGKPSDGQLAHAYKGYLHYLARFKLNNNCITHAVHMSSNPTLIGHAHSRTISVMDSQTLHYEGVDNPETPLERRHVFIWRRLN